MENQIVLLDTSILIDFFRKTDKTNSKLLSLVKEGYKYKISSITEYEINEGATPVQMNFWNDFLLKTEVLPFDTIAARMASGLNKDLKKKRKLIEIADLFIASIAIINKLPLATLNSKHFERIDNLLIV